MEWTPEAVARLTELWQSGLQSSSIASELGCTKNMVIGKANRMGLERRKVVAPKALPPKLLELSGPVCCWPKGHPGAPDFQFCGAKALPGKSYCAEHQAIAYVPKAPARDPLARSADVRRAERIR